MRILVGNKEYKVKLTKKVVKDLNNGKITLDSIQNVLQRKSEFLENINDDTFLIEDAEYDVILSGYKETDIEVQFAVFRNYVTKITVNE